MTQYVILRKEKPQDTIIVLPAQNYSALIKDTPGMRHENLGSVDSTVELEQLPLVVAQTLDDKTMEFYGYSGARGIVGLGIAHKGDIRVSNQDEATHVTIGLPVTNQTQPALSYAIGALVSDALIKGRASPFHPPPLSVTYYGRK